MNGEADLKTLLTSLQPVMLKAAYVFCTVEQEQYDRLSINPLGTFREQEGITLIITEEQASQAGLQHESTWACISLTVHSSLSAVGFLAVLTGRLAKAGISVNAVSAYYHDHLFVPWESREIAMDLLSELRGADDTPTRNI